MRRLRVGTAGLAMVMILMVPRAASAGMGELVDYIIGLTGPQMIGIPIACQLNLETSETACYLSHLRIPPQDAGADDRYWQNRRFWASIGGAVYFSTGKNSEMREFEAFRVGMLGFEPMLNYRTVASESRNFAVEHGAGPSLLYLFGKGFDSFVKGGIKVRPLAVTWTNIGRRQLDFGVAYNLRIFPKAFTSEDFGVSPGTTTHSGREIAHGITIIAGF